MHRLANAANALTNAEYSVLSFLEAQPEEWTPTQLAKELTMPPGTVRWALKKLSEKGKVFYRAEGCTHLYAATIRFTDDFNRLFKAHGTQNRYEIHGLSLKLQGNFANNIPQGGGVVRERFKYYGGGTSFQLSRGTFMVWGSFTSRPLDFDRFVLWMAAVDGYCRARGWPVIEGNIKQWRVVQYGFNRDWKRFRNDSPTRCVSLQGFRSWFARVYEKEGLGVLREEIHSADERSLEQFVWLCDGSMTSVQVMQHLELVTRSLNTAMAINIDMVKVVGRLRADVEKLTKQIKALKDK